MKKLQLTKTVFHFFIQNENPTIYTFQPGQYGTFIIDENTRRQYTFASAPDPKTFELVVDVSPMGPGSKYFLEKNVGERVEYLAPLGNFTLSQNLLKKVFVATGTGIAPFRSMLLKEVRSSSFLVPSNLKIQENKIITIHEPRSTNQEPGTTTHSLYWGLRYEDDVYWDNEFKALAGQYTGFQYFLSLSKPGKNWQDLFPPSPRLRRAKGHITEHVIKNENNPQNSEFYLCGNSAMISEMETRLSAIKVPKEQVKIDMFY